MTYDPVLDSQPVPRMRLLSPLRPPAPGRALVLVPDHGTALTVKAGEEVPDARFGAYQTVFTVDMSEHRVTMDIPLLSRDPTFSFRGRVSLFCRVADPAEVVARRIRDMSGAMYGHIKRMLRRVSREFDIAEFHEAEEALNVEVRDFTGDSAIHVRGIQVELLVDDDEIAASGRAYRDVVRETRLADMRRRRHLDLIREEGADGLLAEIMEQEGARAALDRLERSEAERREARLAAMRMVLERGDGHREPFEQAELERAVLDEVLDEDRHRGRRLRGALASAAGPLSPDSPSAKPISAGPVPTEPARDHEPVRAGSVVRGEVLADGFEQPPPDEPLTGTEGGGSPASGSAPATPAGSGPSPRPVSRLRGTASRRSRGDRDR
ncbi:hypothetical protein [Streptomyces triticirhizae]|nr:hypothetical protein [Streptomyces triticirhizae]